ncbi:hypothetical protein FRC14_006208 [Serendipita sp. 396]|nr:hypothetical protein FRC14_006208 [Serendipita sp. 396]
MISGFFIFNQKGEVLITRLYRTDIKRSISEVFRIHVVSSSDVRSPIVTLGSTSFLHVRHNNIYVLAVTKNNANAALIFEFLYKFISISRSYFGKLDEESVKNNFVLIYELIDEILDFGYPQTSEIDTLKAYITTEAARSEVTDIGESSKLTTQMTGAVSWRRGDIKYKKNEAFVDVIENVNLLMSAKGTVLRADVDGQILMRAYLTGMPECKFGLNDKLVLDKAERAADNAVRLDDCQFHQCVQLGAFSSDRTISFIPPDGEFELMKYTASGKAKYVPSENVIVWKIPRIQGGSEATLTANADLTATTTRQAWARPPIDVDFQVLMFTASGLLVRFLKVYEKSGYHSVKWVRYLTRASGTYQIRF